MNTPRDISEFAIVPDPDDERLSRAVTGIDQSGSKIDTHVVHERPLTVSLNAQESVTSMTIGDHPDWRAVGDLLNQGLLQHDDEITCMDYDDDLEVIVVRTVRETNFEEKMK